MVPVSQDFAHRSFRFFNAAVLLSVKQKTAAFNTKKKEKNKYKVTVKVFYLFIAAANLISVKNAPVESGSDVLYSRALCKDTCKQQKTRDFRTMA